MNREMSTPCGTADNLHVHISERDFVIVLREDNKVDYMVPQHDQSSPPANVQVGMVLAQISTDHEVLEVLNAYLNEPEILKGSNQESADG